MLFRSFAILVISQQGTTGGFNGLTDYHMLLGFNLNDDAVTVAIYFITLAFVVGSFFGLRWLLALRFGKLLRASRDGSNRMRFLGYEDRKSTRLNSSH